MSPNTSSTNMNNNDDSSNEWVEIIEPKTKQIIFANLKTGLCAKQPPDGAIVSRSEDFSDHWWELYDQKTGKYYYYNPDQQKTAWTKPRLESARNGENDRNSQKRLLIIPVSKLQASKRTVNAQDHLNTERCDASTQTLGSNVVSIGTQTLDDINLSRDFKNHLKIDGSPKSKTIDSSVSNQEQSLGDNSKPQSIQSRIATFQQSLSVDHRPSTIDKPSRTINRGNRSQLIGSTTQSISSEGEHSSQNSNRSVKIESNLSDNNQILQEPPDVDPKKNYVDAKMRLTRPNNDSGKRPIPEDVSDQRVTTTNKNPASPKNVSRKVTTNNLSHYLVREARAMGIALISDDEVDDDHDSEEDLGADEDEDTELRDDISSRRDQTSDGEVASPEIADNLSDGWKSFSGHESPNSAAEKSYQASGAQKSPIHCETSGPSFVYNHLIDDERSPISCMSQQLDHQKLIDNFRKSRQTSSFGIQDSLGRTYKIDANNAVQRIKTVADSYFGHDKERLTDKQIRHLSTLSTLPRPQKHQAGDGHESDSSRNGTGAPIDADYDIVEENCNYYRDSSAPAQSNQSFDSTFSTAPTAGSSMLQSNAKIETQSPSCHFDRNKSVRGSTFSVESFARENLTRHPKKGSLIFNRKVKWSRMITWTKNPIKQPMISSVSADLASSSILAFKIIQQYMGDRKFSMTKKYRESFSKLGINISEFEKNEAVAKGRNFSRSNSINASYISNSSNNSISMSHHHELPDRIRDELAYEVVVMGCAKSALRDEIYVQMARQLTENPNQASVSLGLILMSIFLSYFSPSNKFSPFLTSFLENHPHPMARDVCLPRLEKHLRHSWLTYCRKPTDGKEISMVRLSITRWPQYCGVFGESLERIMSLQMCSPYLKTLRLPWILTTLGEKLLKTGGAETEGIFRCAADHDIISQLRLEIDCVDFRKITDAKQVHSLLSNVQDPHVIAGLLKLFFRQLHEPVFPSNIYEICLQSCQDGHMACRVFDERLTHINKDVVAYLVRLLQLLARPDKVAHTKMDSSNLSMIWAPNLLRMPQQDSSTQDAGVNGSKWSISNATTTGVACGSDEHDQQPSSLVMPSQSMIFEQTRQEMQFIKSLIAHLDTSFIENVT